MRNTPLLLALAATLGLLHHLSASAAAVTGPPSADTALEAVQAARRVMMDNPAAALAIGIDLERRALTIPDGRQRWIVLSKGKWIAGEASLRLNRIGDARRLIDASYAFAKAAKDPQSQGSSLLSLGSIKSETGDPAGALQDYLAAYQLFIGTGDARSRSIALQDLSQLYDSARDFKRARSYLRQAAEAYSGEPMLRLSHANTMAGLLAEQGQFAAAGQEYRRALAIARSRGAQSLELKVLNNLAFSQINQGSLADASRTLDEALRLSGRTGIPISRDLEVTIAHLQSAQGKTVLARQTMDKVFASRDSGTTLDADAEYGAYKIYKAAGDIKSALAHLEIAGRLQSDALALGISTQASLMAAQFDYATQDLRIASLQATALRRNILLARQAAARQRLIVATITALVLLAMVALLIWLVVVRRSRNRLRAFNTQLARANTDLEVAVRAVEKGAQAEYQARQLALHDALTGLPNRRFLNENFGGLLSGGAEAGQDIVVLLLDLDRFKPINDIYGHEVGDLVLVATANRLASFCGRVGGKAVRVGGDEFVMVVSGPLEDADLERLADEIIADIGEPIYVGGQRLTLGASIGIARSPQDGTAIEPLLRAADIAMYEAKRSGKNTCRFFDPAMKSRQRLRAV